MENSVYIVQVYIDSRNIQMKAKYWKLDVASV